MSDRATLRRLMVWFAVLISLHSADVWAHLTPNSEVSLKVGEHNIVADIIVPQGEYRFATGNPVENEADAIGIARTYLLRNFQVLSADGRKWAIDLRDVEFKRLSGPPDLHAVAFLKPPPGASTRRFSVRWTILVDKLPSHFALL